ncbi:OmpL47-type beta-barrel domain-containing protein [Mesobacillus thioparans]|uniref:OmpL47-type beta-barrel domain-containing protein n=1 Tax=Mesobacillus thioparans TaxID=370439 RepID=UPI0039F0D8F3
MIGKFFKIQTLVVVMVMLAQLILPIGTALANDAGSMLPPSNLAHSKPSPEDVRLSWDTVYGATGYNVYEIKEGQMTLIGTSNTASYAVNDLPEGNYRYTVSTLNGDAESGPSAPISVDIVYPSMAAPANLTYKIQNGNDLILNWTASQYAEEYFIYEILKDGEKKIITKTTSNSYAKTNAVAGSYTYVVTASNKFFGESGATGPITAEVIQPVMQKPENLIFTITNGTDVTLKWQSSYLANKYKIYQMVNGEKILKETVTGTSVKFTNQPEGDYEYIVHSFSDRFGESEEGSRISLAVSTVVMQTPDASARVINFNDIVLSWGRVDYANSYKIYQVINGEKVLKNIVTGTSMTFSRQPAGEYQFEINSYSDRFGESENGSKLTVTVDSYELAAPENGSHKILNGNDLNISWNTVANASEYKIYQNVDGQRVLKDTLTGTTKTYSNLAEGTYDFEIFSSNPRIGESKDGLKISVDIVHPKMAAPGNVEYSTSSPTSFSLSWDKTEYATNYNVYQILDGKKVLKRTVTGMSISYSNMEAGEYDYEVYSYSSRFGESAAGGRVKVTLDGYVMQAPGNLKYSILNGNDIKLEWDSVEYAASYKIYQIIDGEKVLKTTAKGTSAALTNQPAGEYEFVIHSYSYFSSQSPEGSTIKLSLVHPIMEKPENVTASILNGNDVALAWTSVPYANSYNVYELIDNKELLIGSVSSSSSPKKTFANTSEGEHRYIVRSVSSRFGESNEGGKVEVSVVFPKMQKPENLTYSIANGNDIVLKWNSSSFAKSYNVYKIVDEERELLRTVTSTSTTLVNMPEGDYILQVTSVSDRFGESAESSLVEFKLVFPIMQLPANFTYSIANGNDISLRWNASVYANSYNIYQVTDGKKELVRTIKSTSSTFTNMPEGGYTYEVHSFSDRFGESPESAKLELQLTWPKMQPAVLTGSVFNANNITLSWQKVTWANGYQVYKVNGDNRELLYKGIALSYKVYNLTEEKHSFEVVAYSDRFGESPASNRYTETIVYPEMGVPKATLKLLSETSARISWDFVTYANGYNIYELINGKPVLVAEKVNNLSYTLSNLTYANHLYYVTSYSNSFGESAPSETVLAKLIIDEEAPVTTSDAKTGWTNKTTTVKLSATDNETGVAATYYSLNGKDFIEGTTFSIENEGVHHISFYSSDKVGNKEEVQTVEVKIDQTKPQTESDLTGEWSNENVAVKLTAEDNLSGIAKTFYSVDGYDYAEGTEFTVTGDGIHEIKYFSIDHAGNAEEVRTEAVKIDTHAPAMASNIEDKWHQDAFKVELSANDNLSGVAATFYSLDGIRFFEGTELLLEKDGIYTVAYYSVDKAGNIESAKSQTVKVDSQAPETAANTTDDWYQENAEVVLEAEDNLSGIAKTLYAVNGSEFTVGTSFTVSEEGTNEVSFYSVDAAGNSEAQKTITVKVDKTAPEVYAEVNEEYELGSEFAVTYRAKDEHSGVAVEEAVINGVKYKNGDSIVLDQPGAYTFKVTVTDRAGWTTTVEKQFVVYVPISLEVLPKVIKGNKGIFTVKAILPEEFSGFSFVISTVTLNGVAPVLSNSGLKKQAENGHFKFERENFAWKPGKETLQLLAYLDNGYLIKGTASVDVK